MAERNADEFPEDEIFDIFAVKSNFYELESVKTRCGFVVFHCRFVFVFLVSCLLIFVDILIAKDVRQFSAFSYGA